MDALPGKVRAIPAGEGQQKNPVITETGLDILRYICGADWHATTMFTHVLDHKGQTVFEHDLPALLRAVKPFRVAASL